MSHLKDVIAQATDGLTYPSESDEPVKYLELVVESQFLWPPSGTEEFRRLLGGSSIGRKITPFDPRAFLEKWKLAFEAPVDKINQLQKSLTESLIELRGYRVGEVEVEIYLLGSDAEGHVCGINTMSVET